MPSCVVDFQRTHYWQRRWSHAAGKTTAQVVPCCWQTTLTTILTGGISAAVALLGAKIGGDKTVQASREPFEQAEMAEEGNVAQGGPHHRRPVGIRIRLCEIAPTRAARALGERDRCTRVVAQGVAARSAIRSCAASYSTSTFGGVDCANHDEGTSILLPAGRRLDADIMKRTTSFAPPLSLEPKDLTPEPSETPVPRVPGMPHRSRGCAEPSQSQTACVNLQVDLRTWPALERAEYRVLPRDPSN